MSSADRIERALPALRRLLRAFLIGDPCIPIVATLHVDHGIAISASALREGNDALIDALPAVQRLVRAQRDVDRTSEARRALGPGSSRAKVTTANARWSTKCEARDRLEGELRELGVDVHAQRPAARASSSPAIPS